MKKSNLAIAPKTSPETLQSCLNGKASEYSWTGEYSNYPKLVDSKGRECKDLNAIAEHYQSSKNCKKTSAECDASSEVIEMHQREITYCRKQFNYLLKSEFPIGSKVNFNMFTGVVQGYQLSNISLNKVVITLENGKEQTVSALELTKVTQETSSKPNDKIIKFCTKPEIKTIAIANIRRNGGTQQRVSLNHETVKEYAEAMRNGDRFPPVKVRFDGNDYWLTDGFHTTEAKWSIGKTETEAEVTPGTQREAILDSVGVNSNHGLRRSNSDKRKAVTTLLEDQEWKLWSDREIARRCKVSQPFVSKLRSELNAFKRSDNHVNDKNTVTDNVISEKNRIYKDRHGNLSQMNTENIGQVNSTDKEANLDSNSTDNSVAVQTNCTDKNETVQIKEQADKKELINQFEVGQLVKVQLANFHGVSEKLKDANHQYGIITALTETKTSFNVSVLDHSSFVLSPEDIQPVEIVPLNVNFQPKEFIALMSIYPTMYQIEKAIKQGVLGK